MKKDKLLELLEISVLEESQTRSIIGGADDMKTKNVTTCDNGGTETESRTETTTSYDTTNSCTTPVLTVTKDMIA